MGKGNVLMNHNANICQTCKYFRQHYVKMAPRYRALPYGHCARLPQQRREQTHPACQHHRARK